MSPDEQMREIGRLVTERTAAKREAALILRRIQDAASALNKAGAHLMRNYPTADDLNEGLKLLDEVLRFGDVATLKTSVAEYRSLQERNTALTYSLKSAGVE
jgi:hypothetical protein